MQQIGRLYIPALAVLALAIVSGAVLLAARCTVSSPGLQIVISTPSASRSIHVSVTGAVANPGVYSLGFGSTIQDALDAAGGATSGASLTYINLAGRVRDGDELHIPAEGELPQRVNINTADSWLLEALPGIGEETANRIVDYRSKNGSFTRIDDILRVEGIGPSLFEKIKDYISVR